MLVGFFPLVVQRNSDLPDGHPDKLYKGRNVYGCYQVNDESNVAALL